MDVSGVTIEQASVADLVAVEQLLAANQLPLAGLWDRVSTTILVARRHGAVIGSAALETYADGALLRSVAVDRAWRGHGLGQRLSDAALDIARRRGITSVFLLTTTAEGFFPKLGFGRVTREEVPPGVRESVEFTSACPASAVVMRRSLSPL